MNDIQKIQAIAKSILHTDDLGIYGSKDPLSIQAFRDVIQYVSETLKLIRLEIVEGVDSVKLPFVSFAERVWKKGDEGVSYKYSNKPTFGGITITLKKIRAKVVLTTEVIKYCKMEGLIPYIYRKLAESFSIQATEYAWKGDVTSIDEDYAHQNGWLKILSSASDKHEVDWAKNTVYNSTSKKYLWSQMIADVPAQYQQNPYIFFTPDGVITNYLDTLAERSTGLGDSNILNKQVPVFRSKILLSDNFIGTYLDGADTLCKVVYADPKQLVMAMNEDIEITMERDNDLDATIIWGYAYIGFGIENTGSIVYAKDVKIA